MLRPVVISLVLAVAFAIVGVLSGGTQLLYWLSSPGHPMHWWFAHMHLMLGGCIAAVTVDEAADGLARRGVLIRHLVMPGCLDETCAILEWIATTLGPVFAITSEGRALRLQGDTRKTAMEFRKHLGWYTKGLPGAADLRQQLFAIESMSEAEEIFSEYLFGSVRSAA